MATIWKYPLEVTGVQQLQMPAYAKALSVQIQDGQPCLWALVEPDAPLVERAVHTFGTGHEVARPSGMTFVGAYQLSEGALVFHVFEER